MIAKKAAKRQKRINKKILLKKLDSKPSKK